MAAAIGFVGLGIMGSRMARNLARAGYEVTAWNRSKRPGIESLGVALVDSPAEVGRRSGTVITMVTNAAALAAVTSGPEGFYPTVAEHPEALHISMETVGGEATRAQAERAAAAGIGLLGAPVSGGSGGAEAGTLAIMASGPEPLFERSRPIFEVLGDPQKLSYCGAEVGQGPDLKLDNNLNLLDGLVTVLLSCLGAMRGGVAPAVAYKVFLDSTGDSVAMRGRCYLPGANPTNPVDHGFAPVYKLKDALKDLLLWAEKARRQEIPIGRVQHTIDIYHEAMRLGYGELDCSAIANVILARAGEPTLPTVLDDQAVT